MFLVLVNGVSNFFGNHKILGVNITLPFWFLSLSHLVNRWLHGCYFLPFFFLSTVWKFCSFLGCSCKSHIGAICNWGYRELWDNMLGLWTAFFASIMCICFQMWLVWGHYRSEQNETGPEVHQVESSPWSMLCFCCPRIYVFCNM